MYRPITMYQIVCDRCGKVFEGTEVQSNYLSEPHIDNLRTGDWEKVGDRIYCPDCYYARFKDGMYYVFPRKKPCRKVKQPITDFERGQWSVLQNAIVNIDEVSASDLLKEAGFSKKRIKELQEDCGNSFEQEVLMFFRSPYVKHKLEA